MLWQFPGLSEDQDWDSQKNRQDLKIDLALIAKGNRLERGSSYLAKGRVEHSHRTVRKTNLSQSLKGNNKKPLDLRLEEAGWILKLCFVCLDHMDRHSFAFGCLNSPHFSEHIFLANGSALAWLASSLLFVTSLWLYVLWLGRTLRILLSFSTQMIDKIWEHIIPCDGKLMSQAAHGKKGFLMGEKGIVSGVLVTKDPSPPNERIGIFTSLTKFLIAYWL